MSWNTNWQFQGKKQWKGEGGGGFRWVCLSHTIFCMDPFAEQQITRIKHGWIVLFKIQFDDQSNLTSQNWTSNHNPYPIMKNQICGWNLSNNIIQLINLPKLTLLWMLTKMSESEYKTIPWFRSPVHKWCIICGGGAYTFVILCLKV